MGFAAKFFATTAIFTAAILTANGWYQPGVEEVSYVTPPGYAKARPIRQHDLSWQEKAKLALKAEQDALASEAPVAVVAKAKAELKPYDRQIAKRKKKKRHKTRHGRRYHRRH
jgi:predicted Zn-dependent protease